MKVEISCFLGRRGMGRVGVPCMKLRPECESRNWVVPEAKKGPRDDIDKMILVSLILLFLLLPF